MEDGYANTIAGLQRKHAAITHEIDGLRLRIAKLSNDRVAIERGLEAFGAGQPPRLPRHYEATFKRGDLGRLILRHIRQHGASTTRDIASAILADRGEDPLDRERYAKMQRAVSRALILLADRGGVVRSGSSRGYVWRLTDASD